MTLRVKLGSGRPAEAGDPLGRARVGFDPGLTEAEYLERGRGVWKLDANAVLDEDEIFVVDVDEVVLAVGAIQGITAHGDRRSVECRLVPGHERVGTYLAVPYRSRNAVSYADEDAAFLADPIARVRAVYAGAVAAIAVGVVEAYEAAAETARAGGADDEEIAELAEEAAASAPKNAVIHRDGSWVIGVGSGSLDGPVDPTLAAVGYVATVALEDLFDRGSMEIDDLRYLAGRGGAAAVIRDVLSDGQMSDLVARMRTVGDDA